MGFKKFSFYAYTILIILLTWPLFSAWIPALVKYWYWLPLGIIFSVIYLSEYYKSKQLFYTIWYILVVYINCLLGDTYISDGYAATGRLMEILFITSAPFFFLNYSDDKSRKLFYYTFLTLLIITSVASYYWTLQFPNVIRHDITIIDSSETYEFAYLYRLGLTRYQFAHAVPIIIPPLVMAFKDNRQQSIVSKLFFAFIIILCVIHTYVSDSTTAFMMSIIAVILSFLIGTGDRRRQRGRLIVGIIVLLPFLNSSFLLFVLDLLDSIIGAEGVIHEHINEIQLSISQENAVGGVEARQGLYETSWNMFFHNPLIGTNGNTGHHSVLIDHLGAYGLIGFIPFFALLWASFKYVLRRIDEKNHSYCYISGLCALLMFALKNVSFWAICCFLYVAVPVFILHFSRDRSSGTIKLP